MYNFRYNNDGFIEFVVDAFENFFINTILNVIVKRMIISEFVGLNICFNVDLLARYCNFFYR